MGRKAVVGCWRLLCRWSGACQRYGQITTGTPGPCLRCMGHYLRDEEPAEDCGAAACYGFLVGSGLEVVIDTQAKPVGGSGGAQGAARLVHAFLDQLGACCRSARSPCPLSTDSGP